MEKDRFVIAEFAPLKTVVLSENTDSDNEMSLVENNLQLEIENASNVHTARFLNEINERESIPNINERNDNISVMYVYFLIGEGEEYLTSQKYAEKITCEVPFLWKVDKIVDKDGLGVYFKVYPSLTLSLKPREKIFISFNNIVAFSRLEKMVFGVVKFVNIIDNEDGFDFLPIFKKRSKPEIKYFESEKSTVGIEDVVHLKWNAIGAKNGCKITPYDIDVEQIGELDIKVYEDTEFMLYVNGKDKTQVSSYNIYVKEPEILSFDTADKKHKINFGDKIEFNFDVVNVEHVYLNQGIGKVVGKSCEVIPIKSPINYILSCLGQNNIVTKNISIEIVDYLEINYLSFNRFRKRDNTYVYYLSWKIENANSISLITSDGIERSDSQSEGKTEIFDENDTPLTLHVYCTGNNHQIIDIIYHIEN